MSFDANQQLVLALGRVEGKIDAFAQSQVRQEARLDSHDTRIATLERWQARVLGMGAIAGAVASALWSYFMK